MTEHEPDAPLPHLTTVRVRRRSNDSRFVTGLGLAVVFVGVALLKPWGAGSPEPTRPPVVLAPTSVPVTPIPTEDRSAEGLATEFCLGAGGWQVASLETWQTQDVRVWRAIEPIADATGPADPAIPFVPIVALEIAALGWCAPAYGPDRPAGPATVTAWYVRGGIVTELRLHKIRPADGVTELGALYVPLTACPERTHLRAAASGAGAGTVGHRPGRVPLPGRGEGHPGLARRRRRHPAFRQFPVGESDRLVVSGPAWPQRSLGSWRISYVARARIASPIPVSHRPGNRVKISAGSEKLNAPSDASSTIRYPKPIHAAAVMSAYVVQRSAETGRSDA